MLMMKFVLLILLCFCTLKLCYSDIYYANGYSLTDAKPFIQNSNYKYELKNEMIVDNVEEMKQHAYAHNEIIERKTAIEVYMLQNGKYLIKYWRLVNLELD